MYNAVHVTLSDYINKHIDLKKILEYESTKCDIILVKQINDSFHLCFIGVYYIVLKMLKYYYF